MMITTQGCSQCKSEREHCDECSRQITLEINCTPPNYDGEIVINFKYPNSRGEVVIVRDAKSDEEI